jgi:N-acetylmuramoyl-L-alanine amidase
MKATRTFALVLTVLLAAAAAAGAQEKNLLSVVKDLGALLEWDPLRDSGVIMVGEDRIAIGVGSDSALINYRLKVQIDPPERRDGAVWLTTAAMAAISDAVQKDRLAHAGEKMRVAFILIDPGHGGIDGGGAGSYIDGATRVTVKEKDITLRVGLLLGALLKAGFSDAQVIFTRESDEKVTLEKRVDVANALLEKTSDTVLFLSIHANTTPFNRAASGYEVWCLPPEYTRTLVDEKAAGKENADIASILNSMREEEISMESNLLARDPRGPRRNRWCAQRQQGTAAHGLVRRAQCADARGSHRGRFCVQRGGGGAPGRPGILAGRGQGHILWRGRIHPTIRRERESRCSIDWIFFCVFG